MWDLPGPGLEPVSPASAGRFSTTAPPGKPQIAVFTDYCAAGREWVDVWETGWEAVVQGGSLVGGWEEAVQCDARISKKCVDW